MYSRSNQGTGLRKCSGAGTVEANDVPMNVYARTHTLREREKWGRERGDRQRDRHRNRQTRLEDME